MISEKPRNQETKKPRNQDQTRQRDIDPPTQRYGTLSLVAGPDNCNARCPFCIAVMVPSEHVVRRSTPVNTAALRQALSLATGGGCDTVLITGNGEPTIFPDQITAYLRGVAGFEADERVRLRKELQTNGILLESQPKQYDQHLRAWAGLGLQTIAVSVSHYDRERNKEIYTPKKDYIDLGSLIVRIKQNGIRVRLTTVMIKGYIDSIIEVEKMLSFARQHGVDEVTFLPVNEPDISYAPEVSDWVRKNRLPDDQLALIQTFFATNASLVKTFGFGGMVYDYKGQNVCLTNCVAKMPEEQGERRLIFYPDGTMATDWDDSTTFTLPEE